MPDLNITDIAALLLSDGWHDVTPGSLTLDGSAHVHNQGVHVGGTILPYGCKVTFTDSTGQRITAVVDSITAVRHN